jgi:HEAT repeat protein/uncharacterized tellurite resistance protein B-like protein
MPKHRKNKPSRKKENKRQEQPRKPEQERPSTGTPTDYDDDVSAAVAAYLSDIDESDQAVVAAEVRRLLDTLGNDFEIIDPEEEDEDDDALIDPQRVSPGLRPKPTVDQALNRLITDRDLALYEVFYVFSDLTLQDAELLRQQWELVDPARRAELVTEMVELAAEDIDLHLSRFLRVVINDSNPSVRQSAIQGLWGEASIDMIGPFVQFLHNDPDTGVRAAAATGLGPYILAGELEELDSALAMRAEEALLAVLNNNEEPLEVRRRALESIAYSSEAGVRQLIEDGYYSADEMMRVSAVFAMGRSADVRWRGLVRAELRSPSADMRAEAAIATGELGAKSAVEDLAELLQDRVERVRLAAIFALGQVGGDVARDLLEVVLLSDNELEVETAEIALEEMQFIDLVNDAPLFDELMDEDEDEEWESDAEDDEWYDELSDGMNEADLGEYEDNPEDDNPENG